MQVSGDGYDARDGGREDGQDGAFTGGDGIEGVGGEGLHKVGVELEAVPGLRKELGPEGEGGGGA